MYQLDFQYRIPYREIVKAPNDNSPYVGLRLRNLRSEDGVIDVIAIVDSGALYSLFDGRICNSLGLTLRNGPPINLFGLAGGQLRAYIHPVIVEIEGERLQCNVAFSEVPISRNLLGRFDLFEKITLGIQARFRYIYFHPLP